MREMRRERIDRAVHAQLARLTALLRDIDRSGGTDRWPHLWSHGHHWATVMAATRQGHLRQRGLSISAANWALTMAGRRHLRDLDAAAVRAQ